MDDVFRFDLCEVRDGNWVGYVTVGTDENGIDTRVLLYNLFVKPNYRCKGIASYLVKKAIKIAKNDYGVKELYLWCETNLINFYIKLGFVKTNEIKNKFTLLKINV